MGGVLCRGRVSDPILNRVSKRTTIGRGRVGLCPAVTQNIQCSPVYVMFSVRPALYALLHEYGECSCPALATHIRVALSLVISICEHWITCLFANYGKRC